jgi:hypothetical protein
VSSGVPGRRTPRAAGLFSKPDPSSANKGQVVMCSARKLGRDLSERRSSIGGVRALVGFPDFDHPTDAAIGPARGQVRRLTSPLLLRTAPASSRETSTRSVMALPSLRERGGAHLALHDGTALRHLGLGCRPHVKTPPLARLRAGRCSGGKRRPATRQCCISASRHTRRRTLPSLSITGSAGD